MRPGAIVVSVERLPHVDSDELDHHGFYTRSGAFVNSVERLDYLDPHILDDY